MDYEELQQAERGERIANYLREKREQREAEEQLRAARSGPHADEIEKLEKQAEAHLQTMRALMTQVAVERRTLDYYEGPEYDREAAALAAVERQIRRLVRGW